MMTDLISLWLPILASAVAVFFASFVLWAATPWHKPDIRPVPNTAAADRMLEDLSLPPGFYMVPCTHDAKEMKSQAYQDRFARGPWASITVLSGKPNMGRNMALSFITTLTISLLIAYLAGSVLAPGTQYLRVFQVVGTAAILAYTFGGIMNGIWFGKPRGWMIRDIIDALIYSMLTAGMFAWLWPAVTASNPTLPIP